MKKGRTAITFAVGVCAGFALCGPAAQAASHLTATLSNQLIYVDGQRAYSETIAVSFNPFVPCKGIGSPKSNHQQREKHTRHR